MFKDLNEVPPSDDWSPYEYIDADVKKKLDETKGQLVGDETEKKTKHYMESIYQNPNWLNNFSIEMISSSSIVNTLTSSCKCICNGEKMTVPLHPSEN